MKNRIHTALFYSLLVCVYGIFFSVESFYNFEGQASIQKTCPHHAVVKNASVPVSSHGFRLNKRYHQENIPPCPIISPVTPERCITPVRIGLYGDEALPSVAIVHNSLRGPPTAA